MIDLQNIRDKIAVLDSKSSGLRKPQIKKMCLWQNSCLMSLKHNSCNNLCSLYNASCWMMDKSHPFLAYSPVKGLSEDVQAYRTGVGQDW